MQIRKLYHLFNILCYNESYVVMCNNAA
uniref:Uncharacterized protein n=1 Tax=Arundo donax TaxID=35708 RepID=A0A0A9HHD8_ARUDO